MRILSYPPENFRAAKCVYNLERWKMEGGKGLFLFRRGTDAFPMFALQFWLLKRVTVDKYYRWGRKLPRSCINLHKKRSGWWKGGRIGALITKPLKGRPCQRLAKKS